VTNTYITNVSSGIVAQTTSGELTVTINQTTIANPTVYGFEAAGGTIDATITNTLIANTGASAVIGLAGSPQINVDSSSVVDSTIPFHAASASTVIRISNNNIYNGHAWRSAGAGIGIVAHAGYPGLRLCMSGRISKNQTQQQHRDQPRNRSHRIPLS
jgi:hypothetical protein